MKQKLYLECFAGISGDMTVAALLDLGADAQKLKETLASLPLEGYTVEIGRAKKGGLSVCDFDVKVGGVHDGHTHTHRGLAEITEIIVGSQMSAAAKETALRIFDILAQAEAEAHGVSPRDVHFHEVGAVDSIVDIAAAAICLDDLGIEEAILPVLWEGCGTIPCQHGILPVPVPATLNIVKKHQLPLHLTETEGEFVTPTGAAIAAALYNGEKLPANFRVDRIGLGGGKREYERPSILRAMLITPLEQETGDGIWKLECNIDDCSGEAAGYAMERLFEAGAKDVHFTPTFMKKNRPGYLITVLCAPEDVGTMEEILFAETTTIGIRRQWMERTVLPREDRKVLTSLGEVRVKVVKKKEGETLTPEYESVAAIAREKGIPYIEAYRQITQEI